MLEEFEGTRTRDLQLGEWGQVEEADPLPGGAMLGADERGPVSSAPALTGVSLFGTRETLAVGEPLGPFPAGAFEHLPTQFLQARLKGTQAQPARALELLAGMDDVVDFPVLAPSPRQDVGPAGDMGVEAVAVQVSQVQRGKTVHHVPGNGPAHAAAVGQPNPLRQPEALQTSRSSQKGLAVGSEREDSVYPEGERRLPQAGEQLPGVGDGVLEVVRWKRTKRRLGRTRPVRSQ